MQLPYKVDSAEAFLYDTTLMGVLLNKGKNQKGE